MRKLIVTRRKSFVGALIPYFCIVGIGKTEVDDSDVQYPIRNGETIEIEVGNQPFCIVVVADTSTGLAFTEPIFFAAGEEHIAAELITHYSWTKGSSYELKV